jgi:hypothetical protein
MTYVITRADALAARGRSRRGSATQAKPPAPLPRINSLRRRHSACRDFYHGLLGGERGRAGAMGAFVAGAWNASALVASTAGAICDRVRAGALRLIARGRAWIVSALRAPLSAFFVILSRKAAA